MKAASLAGNLFDKSSERFTAYAGSDLGGAIRFGKADQIQATLAQLFEDKGVYLTAAAAFTAEGDTVAGEGAPSQDWSGLVAAAIDAGAPVRSADGLTHVVPVTFGKNDSVVGAFAAEWTDRSIAAEVQASAITLALIGLGIGLVVCVAATFVTARILTRPLSDLSTSVTRVLAGEATEIAGRGRRDEIGALAGTLSEIYDQSLAAARLKASLDSASSLLMVTDTDYNIVYLNAPLSELLKNSEADIRKNIPNFDASTLMGANIDVFHKDPAHQRKMLATLSERLDTRLVLGGRTLALAVSPVFGPTGERIGTVVEWRDQTAEIRATGEIDAVVAAVADGDFSRRADLTGAPTTLREMGERVNQVAETVAAGVEETNRVARRMAEGDLTGRMEGAFAGAFADLQGSLNSALDRIAQLVGDIQNSVATIQGETGGIADGAADLSSRAESQASSLQETAATMEELSATIKTNADNADRAGGLSAEAVERAERGGDVVSETVSAMQRIEEGSGRISDIISVIDSIAFQTNLLALNAAVEAARAGDAGKGFAVVASEVRTLAQRSAEAAQDIKALINESTSQVSEGVGLVNRTGDALSEIIASVQSVAETIGAISSATREQASGVQEISVTVSHMDEMTQQNSSMAEHSASACRALAAEGGKLSEMVAFFQVDAAAADRDAA